MTQTFIDTIVICTMTGLVILVTGSWQSGETGAAILDAHFALRGRAVPVSESETGAMRI